MGPSSTKSKNGSGPSKGKGKATTNKATKSAPKAPAAPAKSIAKPAAKKEELASKDKLENTENHVEATEVPAGKPEREQLDANDNSISNPVSDPDVRVLLADPILPTPTAEGNEARKEEDNEINGSLETTAITAAEEQRAVESQSTAGEERGAPKEGPELGAGAKVEVEQEGMKELNGDGDKASTSKPIAKSNPESPTSTAAITDTKRTEETSAAIVVEKKEKETQNGVDKAATKSPSVSASANSEKKETAATPKSKITEAKKADNSGKSRSPSGRKSAKSPGANKNASNIHAPVDKSENNSKNPGGGPKPTAVASTSAPAVAPVRKVQVVKPRISANAIATLERHPLHFSWTLWYQSNKLVRSWEDSFKSICTFQVAETFWALLDKVRGPSELSAGSSYYLFKEGIFPDWHDKQNRNGGRWIILNDTKNRGALNEIWVELLMLLIGEGFGDDGEEICGAGLELRGKGDKITVWTANFKNEEAILNIGRKIKNCLQDVRYFAPRQRMTYEIHEDPDHKPMRAGEKEQRCLYSFDFVGMYRD